MTRFGKIMAVVLVLLGFVPIARAVTLSTLYQVRLPVHSQVVWRRLKMMPDAMRQVLVKVSGNPQILSNNDIQSALNQAPDYVRQFSYLNNPDKDPKKPYLVQFSFDGVAIRKLLQAAGQPIWGSNRPLVVAWIEVNQGQSHELIGSDSSSPVTADINGLSQYLGVPLVLPMLDLSDIQSVGTESPLSAQWPNIQAASQRYLPDAILIGDVDATDPKAVSARWQLNNGGDIAQWQTQGSSVKDAVDQGITTLTQNLAKQYAVVENMSQQQTVQIQMVGIKTIAQFAKASRYLNSLVGVKHVDVGVVSADQVIYNLALVGQLPSLLNEIRLGKQLVPVSQNLQPGPQQAMVYQFG
jgi:uncharacterized protein